MAEGEPVALRGEKEKGSVTARIDEKSEAAFSDQEWQNEKTFKSSELIVLRGMVEGEQRGALLASFVVEREFDEKSSDFKERDRLVDLRSISVWPVHQRGGLGTAMLGELERLARRFGASVIKGTLSAVDLEEKPWLVGYYRKRGFELEQKGAGYKLVKRL